MEINAYEKIKKALTDACCDFEYETCDLLDETDGKAKEWLFETATGQDIMYFLKERPDAKVSATKYLFKNGLDFFSIEYSFTNEKGNPFVQREFALMTEFQKLVYVVFQSEQKTFLSILKDKGEKELCKPLSIGEKIVEIATTQISVNNRCGSYFTTYTNLTDCTLLKEEYVQDDPILKEYDDSNRILECKDPLTILYCDSKPVHAQLDGNCRIENFGYDSNSSEDALKIVGVVNQEVDAICERIQSVVDDYLKEHKEVQKTIGTNPDV